VSSGHPNEDHARITYSAGFLVDREGGLAGCYRRTHLTVQERIFSDIGRRDDAPVLKTDFAAVALEVCFDFHFPEVARLLALMAELVLGLRDLRRPPPRKRPRPQRRTHRQGVRHPETYPVVFAVALASDRQPSPIIDQSANVLARSDSTHHIIRVGLDLAARPLRWSGDEYRSIHPAGRRPEMYRDLGMTDR
jgi:predicted amidohydrolase